MQQKKTRRGREYLNDFRRDVNGSYLYQGSYRRYTGSMPYAKRFILHYHKRLCSWRHF